MEPSSYILMLDEMIRCSSCGIEQTVSEFKKSKLFKCTCGHEFTHLEGHIQYLISPIIFSQYSFISDFQVVINTNIEIGTSKVVDIGYEVANIEKVFISPYGHAYVTSKDIGDNKILIMSSMPEGSAIKLNDILKVSIFVYGNNSKNDIPIWKRLLMSAKEDIIRGKYNTSLLNSAISFESYVDSILEIEFKKLKTPQEAIITILSQINNIKKKVRNLLPELTGIDIKAKNKEIFNRWDKKVIEKRNLVAHGEDVQITEHEANEAFEIVLRAIFYIDEQLNYQIKSTQ